jgi:hypothetical protein
MRVWLSKNLGDGLMATEDIAGIEEAFRLAHAEAGNPADMATFIRHDSEGRLHCEVTVYFSPTTAELARRLGASPCPKPSPAGLGLLAGGEEAWPTLFPEDAS